MYIYDFTNEGVKWQKTTRFYLRTFGQNPLTPIFWTKPPQKKINLHRKTKTNWQFAQKNKKTLEKSGFLHFGMGGGGMGVACWLGVMGAEKSQYKDEKFVISFAKFVNNYGNAASAWYAPRKNPYVLILFTNPGPPILRWKWQISRRESQYS